MKNGTSPFAFGTGPYIYSDVSNDTDSSAEINIKYGNVSLIKNPNYWNGNVPLEGINFNKYFDTESSIKDVISGIVDLVWGYQFTNKTYADTQSGFNFYSSISGDNQFIAVNMHHPIFGTGVDTPVGQINPEKAAYAARMVRSAISHVVPRQKIVDEFIFGDGIPAATPIASNVLGWSDNFAVHQYDPQLALNLLKLAGYNNSSGIITTSQQLESSTTESGPIHWISQIILFVIVIQFVSKKQINHSNK